MIVLALIAAFLGIVSGSDCDKVIELTNPFIGSGGLGFGYGSVSPAACYVQGPVRLGPDTSSSAADLGFEHFSGYFYADKFVRMFSHTRYVGAGINGLGAFGVMPVRRMKGDGLFSNGSLLAKELELQRDKKERDGKEYLWWSAFEKETEEAHAGYYKVVLSDPEVEAKMLATSRLTAIHSYTWQRQQGSKSDGEAVLIIDALHQTHIEDSIAHGGTATIDVSSDGTSFGAEYTGGGYSTFMYAELRVVRDSSSSDSRKPMWLTCSNSISGAFNCSDAIFIASREGDVTLLAAISLGTVSADDTLEVELHVALSFISVEQAKQNLQNKNDGITFTFAEEFESTKAAWCDALSFFDFEVLDDEKFEDGFPSMLMTAASRSRMTPAVYSEGGDGLYMGLDQTVHNSTPERAHYSNQQPSSLAFYSDFSLWDVFRTQLPWLLLTDEPVSIGILRSLSEMTTQQGGYFPKWTTASLDKGVMIGLPGASMALEASFISGMTEQIDIATIQAALQQQATDPECAINARVDLAFYLENGYVSSEKVEKGSSYTLSYALDDYILAGLSKVVGKDDDATAAAIRASNYKNIFDASTLLMCPKSIDGTITCAEHPQRDFDHYTEGNALHWTYFVPHDIDGLRSLYPSDEVFDKILESFFDKHLAFQKAYGNFLPNPYYWAGNEPTMLTPWLFNYGTNKRCHLTQKWSRAITHLHFSNKPSGIPGNDDYASMSSFLLFSSLGVYPAATQDYFLLGSPRVKSGRLQLRRADGTISVLSIATHNNSADNVYVHKLLVNGREWTSTTIFTSVLKAPGGCTLDFYMTDQPFSSLCQ